MKTELSLTILAALFHIVYGFTLESIYFKNVCFLKMEPYKRLNCQYNTLPIHLSFSSDFHIFFFKLKS